LITSVGSQWTIKISTNAAAALLTAKKWDDQLLSILQIKLKFIAGKN
jgi:hypothetical protein